MSGCRKLIVKDNVLVSMQGPHDLNWTGSTVSFRNLTNDAECRLNSFSHEQDPGPACFSDSPGYAVFTPDSYVGNPSFNIPSSLQDELWYDPGHSAQIGITVCSLLPR